MYEDSATDSVNTSYCLPGSARSVTTSEVYALNPTSDMRSLGHYWLYNYEMGTYSKDTTPKFVVGNGQISTGNVYSLGIRPVVTLKSGIKVKAIEGQTTHDTPETAWILSLEE